MAAYSGRMLKFALAIMMPAVVFAQAANPVFHVAPDGDDAQPGSLEKPFATLERARQAVRGVKASPGAGGPIVVALRGGVYYLKEPVVFTPEDSGSAQAPVSYQAYGDEVPVLSGGREIGGWQVTGDRWTTRIPEAAGGQWRFTRVFVNGESRYRPRLPAKGYFAVRAEMEPTEPGKKAGYDRIGFHPGDIMAAWHNPRGRGIPWHANLVDGAPAACGGG